jgi:hypothetical protein
VPTNNSSEHPPPLQAAIDKYKAWQIDYLKRQDAENKITETLYHYTDARGLCGIFEDEQIWFTDYRHLNDPSEFLHGLEFARDIAGRLKQDSDVRKQYFLDQFINNFRREIFDRRLEFYIASFSREPDDLSQWRSYADNGRGFAIGFAPPLFGIEEKQPSGKPLELVGAVKYTREDIDALYTPPIEEAAQIFLTAATENPALMVEGKIRNLFTLDMIRELIATVVFRSLITKHPAYKNEREVRLIITTPIYSRYVKTRLRAGEIVPYIPQPFAEVRGNVAKIVIGPAAPPDTERTLRKFLGTVGMEKFDNISRSDIPYRAL